MTTAKDLDQFYTKESVAMQCISDVLALLPAAALSSHSVLFVEPSAGSGAFYKNLNGPKVGLDLDPKFTGIVKQDFLTWDYSLTAAAAYSLVVSIGNPPFGKNASLAIKFVNKCAEYSDLVAFILPKTFKKASILPKLNKYLVLKFERDIPPNSFEFEGNSYDVPCVFQVWEKVSVPREDKKSPITHPDFEFCEKDVADFAIRRVGGLAGKVIENFQSYAEASHYYIKSNIDKKVLIEKFSKINWDAIKHNTAGNPSIGKRELIAEYSK